MTGGQHNNDLAMILSPNCCIKKRIRGDRQTYWRGLTLTLHVMVAPSRLRTFS